MDRKFGINDTVKSFLFLCANVMVLIGVSCQHDQEIVVRPNITVSVEIGTCKGILLDPMDIREINPIPTAGPALFKLEINSLEKYQASVFINNTNQGEKLLGGDNRIVEWDVSFEPNNTEKIALLLKKEDGRRIDYFYKIESECFKRNIVLIDKENHEYSPGSMITRGNTYRIYRELCKCDLDEVKIKEKLQPNDIILEKKDNVDSLTITATSSLTNLSLILDTGLSQDSFQWEISPKLSPALIQSERPKKTPPREPRRGRRRLPPIHACENVMPEYFDLCNIGNKISEKYCLSPGKTANLLCNNASGQSIGGRIRVSTIKGTCGGFLAKKGGGEFNYGWRGRSRSSGMYTSVTLEGGSDCEFELEVLSIKK